MSECMTISVPEAGRRLGVGRCTAFRLAREGKLPVLKLGKKLRVPISVVDEMLASASGKMAEHGGTSDG